MSTKKFPTRVMYVTLIESWIIRQLIESSKTTKVDEKNRIGIPDNSEKILKEFELEEKDGFTTDDVQDVLDRLSDIEFIEHVGKSGNQKSAYRLKADPTDYKLVEISHPRVKYEIPNAFVEIIKALTVENPPYVRITKDLRSYRVWCDTWLKEQHLNVNPHTLAKKLFGFRPFDLSDPKWAAQMWGIFVEFSDTDGRYLRAVKGFLPFIPVANGREVQRHKFHSRGVIKQLSREVGGPAPVASPPVDPVPVAPQPTVVSAIDRMRARKSEFDKKISDRAGIERMIQDLTNQLGGLHMERERLSLCEEEIEELNRLTIALELFAKYQ